MSLLLTLSILNFENFPSVSIVDFQHVSVYWVEYRRLKHAHWRTDMTPRYIKRNFSRIEVKTFKKLHLASVETPPCFGGTATKKIKIWVYFFLYWVYFFLLSGIGTGKVKRLPWVKMHFHTIFRFILSKSLSQE